MGILANVHFQQPHQNALRLATELDMSLSMLAVLPAVDRASTYPINGVLSIIFQYGSQLFHSLALNSIMRKEGLICLRTRKQGSIPSYTEATTFFESTFPTETNAQDSVNTYNIWGKAQIILISERKHFSRAFEQAFRGERRRIKLVKVESRAHKPEDNPSSNDDVNGGISKLVEPEQSAFLPHIQFQSLLTEAHLFPLLGRSCFLLFPGHLLFLLLLLSPPP
ncbi:hypothetical protein V2J09_009530 [Rumex salicifolius]